MREILRAEQIYKSYKDSDKDLKILKGCDLTVNEGDFISISGPSGCGKSTLLQILALLDSADKGEIYYLNEKIKNKNLADFRNKSIGFVFQFHYLLEDLTAIENVALPHFIRTKNYTQALQAAKELLLQFNLDDRANHFPNQMSGGEQQRISIARALINNPLIIYADEPTGNLDSENSNLFFETIKTLNAEKGLSFVIVTHNYDLASSTKKQYHLQNGILELS